MGAVTGRATRYAIGYERFDDVVAKGKAEPVETWLATEVLSAPAERPERLGRFVARDREIEIVRSV